MMSHEVYSSPSKGEVRRGTGSLLRALMSPPRPAPSRGGNITALLAAVLLAFPASAAERYKPGSSTRDLQEMERTLAPGKTVALKDFLRAPQGYHWVAFYEAADQLFQVGRNDEALQWFYVGQIRARVAAGLDPDASRNNAMLVAMNAGIGTPIMAYAKADKDNWAEQIDAALAWDKDHPLPADPKTVIGVSDVAFDSVNFRLLYEQVRTGLKGMRAEIAAE